MVPKSNIVMTIIIIVIMMAIMIIITIDFVEMKNFTILQNDRK